MRTRAFLVTAAVALSSSCSGSGTPVKTSAAAPAPLAAAAAPVAAIRPAPARLFFAPEPDLGPIPGSDEGFLVEGEEFAEEGLAVAGFAEDDLPPIPVPADGEVLFLGVPPEEKPLLFAVDEEPDAEPAPDWDGVTVADPVAAEECGEAFEPAMVDEIVYDEGVQAADQTVFVETPVLVIRGYHNYAFGRFPAVCATAAYDPCARPVGGAWWTTGAWDPCWSPCSDPRYRSWDEYWRVCDEEPAARVAAAVVPVASAAPRTRVQGPVYASAPVREGAPRVRDGDTVRAPLRPETPRSVAPIVPPAADAASSTPAPRIRRSSSDDGFRARGVLGRASKSRDTGESVSEDGLLGTPVAVEKRASAARNARREDRAGEDAPAGRGRDAIARGSRLSETDAAPARGLRGRAAHEETAAEAPRPQARAAEPIRDTRRDNRDAEPARDRGASRGHRETPQTPAAAPARAVPAAPAAPAAPPRSDPAPARGNGRKSGIEASPPPPPSRGKK